MRSTGREAIELDDFLTNTKQPFLNHELLNLSRRAFIRWDHPYVITALRLTTMTTSRSPRALRATTKVIVVGGGGTIGSSTALHLLRAGYTPSNITVLDTYPFPSAQSAGNDLNKIMGIRTSSKMEMELSLEAAEMWRGDELFKPWFHRTGRVSELLSVLGCSGDMWLMIWWGPGLDGLRGLGKRCGCAAPGV